MLCWEFSVFGKNVVTRFLHSDLCSKAVFSFLLQGLQLSVARPFVIYCKMHDFMKSFNSTSGSFACDFVQVFLWACQGDERRYHYPRILGRNY